MKPFRTGKWVIYPELNRIEGPQASRRVPPKLVELLVVLVEQKGALVSRDVLLDRVWSGVVVNDVAVSQTVSRLRKLLGDSAKAPAYIETISKRGYRFIGDAVELSDAEIEAGRTARRAGRRSSRRLKSARRVPYAGWLLAALVLALALHG